MKYIEKDYNINKLHQELFEILKVVTDICDRNNLVYFLDSGTALGAYRHGGFIPWDDDIDIGMPRADYDIFLKIAQDELGSKFFLQTRETDPNCPFLTAKVRKNNTKFVAWNVRNLEIHHGIYIDIFPYDKLPINNAIEYKKKIIKKYEEFLLSEIPDRTVIKPKKFSISWSIKAIIRRVLHIIFNFKTSKSLDSEIMSNMTLSEKMENKYMYTSFVDVENRFFEKDILFPVSKIKFNDREFSVPNNIEEYLTTMYGDYMSLPPENERVSHWPYLVEFEE